MSRIAIAVAAILLAGLPSLVRGQLTEKPTPGTVPPAPARRHVADWVRRFATAQEMLAGVDLVVVATAGAAAPGRMVLQSGGAPPLRFETVSLVVREVLRARPPVGAKVGDSLKLERLGTQTSLTGLQTVMDHDLGPLTPGQTYVLFLDRQSAPPYEFIQVTDEARFEVLEDGRLASAAGGVANEIRGQTIASLRSIAQR